MYSKSAVAAALLTAAPLPCHAQSAADAAALVTWGAYPSKSYRVLKRTPSSVEYQWLVSSPVDLKVEETSKCKFLISFHETTHPSGYSGTLDYTAPQWSHLIKTRMKMVDGSLGFEIIHVPGARYCHILGFSPLDYQVTPGACREFSAFIPESSTVNGINALKRFCPGGAAQPGVGSQTVLAKARSIPGQWVFAPESGTSNKLAWQYTPGDSEFLALVISCDATKRLSRVSIDLSLETQAKASQRIAAKITKGVESLVVSGKVETGESGPFVRSAAAYPQVAHLLSQPGDFLVALPHHSLSFSARSFAGPYATFARACQLGPTQ